jgi:hypothetical protein
MNCTGEDVDPDTAALTDAVSRHLQSGVVRTSSNVLPSTKREDPRKHRREGIIDCADYRDKRPLHETLVWFQNLAMQSLARHFRKWMRYDSRALFDRNDPVNRDIRQLVDLTAGPCDHQRLDFDSVAKPEMNPGVAR